MWSVIGDLLPAAVAVALSPIPIVAVVVVLGTPRARTNGPLFALGWVAGLAGVSAAIVVLAGGAGDPDSGTSTAVDAVKLAAGALFWVMAAKQWRSRPAPGEEPELPAWMATLDSAPPRRMLVLGLALSAANPKNLALTVVAAGTIAQADLGAADTAAAVAAFVVIGSLTVVGSVLFSLLAGDRAAQTLGSVREVMTRHNAVIMMVILLVLGAKLVGDGIAGLAG